MITFLFREARAALAQSGFGLRTNAPHRMRPALRPHLSGFSLFVGAWLAIVAPLRALDPAKSVFQFNCQNWARSSGLPADKINAVTQTRDGYIWLGTQNGLIRFDGQEFKAIPIKLPEAQGQDIEHFSLGPDKRLWFSIANGGYGSFDGRNFRAIGDSRWSAPGSEAHAILATPDGAIWTGSSAGWGRWVDGKPDETLFQYSPDAVFGLWTVASGRVWLGTADKGLFHWNGKEFKALDDPALHKSVIESVVEDRAGDTWVATTRGLFRYDAELRPKENFWLGTAIKTLLIDSHGLLWVGTFEDGLGRYQDGNFTMLRKADGLASDVIRTIFEDREGSIWIGTAEGLSQLTDLKFPLMTVKEGLVPGSVNAVAAGRNGGLWSATTQGVSWFDGRNTVRTYLTPSLFEQRAVRRIFEASNGDAVLVDGDRNIGILSGEPPLKIYPNQNWPEALAEDATSVLAGVGPTLMRFEHGKFQPYRFDDPVPPLDWIVNLFVARDNAIWASTNNGLFRIESGKFRRWTTANGISSDRPSYVMEDVDGIIWVGSPAGLTRIKGEQITRINVDDGLPDPRIFSIVADDAGYLWLDSGRGLARVTRQSLTDFADGKIKRITCELFDDLESVKFIDRTDQAFSAAKTADGRLWFPNPHGIIMVNPRSFFTNQVPPVVTIEKVRAGGREFSGADAVTLNPTDRNLEFSFSALSFVAPRKLKVRYQLEGSDSTWVDAGTKRTAAYTDLPAGRYRFRVEAANADGVWNRTANVMEFELPPPFYRRPWFYALIGLAVASGLYGIYRWNVWQLRTHQRRLQADNDRLEVKAAERTKELAQSLSLLTATLESTSDAIMVADLSGQLISCNAKFDAMWQLADLSAETGERARRVSIIAEKVKDREDFLARVNELYAQPEAESRDILELKDGRIIERDSQPQRLDGRCVGRVWCFRDITERRRAEAEIEDIHRQLLAASRRGGMAEIATNVLHNVGNVLNSVNVSAGLIIGLVKNSRGAKLSRVVALMDEHTHDLAAFITEDPRGRNLPGYLSELSTQMQSDQQTVMTEAESLQRNIEHIKEVVAMQQTYARFGGVKEAIDIVELVEDSLRINEAAFTQQHVSVIREFSPVPTLNVEKHKIIQILVNLLRNAKHACQDADRPDRQLVVSVAVNDNRLRVSVRDNGVGIPPENLVRIFNHGFTTRQGGHGFGLHSGALAAREMGGSLTVESAGVGQGATFTLELPVLPIDPPSA